MRLRDLAFWTLVFMLGAAAAHAALLLWLPRHAMSGIMETVLVRHGVNRMRVISAAEWREIAGDADPAMRHAVCLLQPGDGETVIEAPLPAGYWSITVYAPNGAEIYALDDRGVGMRRLRMRFTRAGEMLPGAGGLRTPRLENGVLHVPMNVDRALAVIAAHASYPGLEERLRAALSATTCTRVPGAAGERAVTPAAAPRSPDAVPLPRRRPRPAPKSR
ncbi:MAG TPA: hypothetical protein ENK13_03090 [Thermopetrobacter sp.]|nr:hypothetical protein [Thermopetrobacter sp.]